MGPRALYSPIIDFRISWSWLLVHSVNRPLGGSNVAADVLRPGLVYIAPLGPAFSVIEALPSILRLT
jgi:hypothetical protein